MGDMPPKRPFPPPHLACALASALLLALGAGASCDRRPPPESSGTASQGAPRPPGAPPDEAPTAPTLGTEPLAPFEAEGEPNPSETAPATPQEPAPSVSPSARRAYRIAALGDSLTDARSGGGGYLRVVAEACPETVIDNYGKGGDMVNQMRRRFERDILPRVTERGYTHLVVYGGVNDLYSDETAGRTNDRIQEDLTAIYERAHASGMRVVAVTVSPWGGFTRYFIPRRAETTRQLNAWIAEQGAAERVDRVVDSYPLLSCGDPERLCPDYARPDGLHLNALGQERLGRALLETAFPDCK